MPLQALAVGVMLMLAITGVVPVLEAIKPGIFPAPLAARPIVGLLLVHEKVVPLPTGLVTMVGFTPMPLQKV